jgi:DNA mismatch endonuclease (patch repair protein)
MADVHTKEIRSYNMSRIRSKDTKPELLVRKFLHKHGFRYRLHTKTLPGKPDIVLPKYKTVIFVHGCFWHGHECGGYLKPKSNTEFWGDKMIANKKRDNEKQNMLVNSGWQVYCVWECELTTKKRDEKLQHLIAFLNNCKA